MKVGLYFLLSASLQIVASSQVEPESEDKVGAFGNRRALIIGVDGLRPDALKQTPTPNIDRLIKNGIVSYDAVAGGPLGTPMEQATYSGPGWSTILTGVFANKHGVEDNYFRTTNFSSYPHFFRRLKESHPDAWLGSVVEWGGIDRTLNAAAKDSFNLRVVGPSDEDVADETARILTALNPDVLFIHLIAPDGYGHANGYDPKHISYRYSIRVTDRRIGKILDALNAREGVQSGAEDWLVILVSDHGGLDRFHGGQSVYERQIPLIVSSQHVDQGLEVSPGPDQSAIVPTVFQHLGVAVDPDWGLEGEAFGNVPLPTVNFVHSYRPNEGNCLLSWRRPESDLLVKEYRLYRNGKEIALIDSSESSFVDSWAGLREEEVDVYYELEPRGPQSETMLRSRLVTSSRKFEDSLVGYLPFDGLDSVGSFAAIKVTVNEEDGPSLVESILGSGLFFDGIDDYLRISEADGMPLSLDGDFTVGFWYMMDQAHIGSPVLIGNKNWSVLDSPGFALLGSGGDDVAIYLSDGEGRLSPPTTDLAINQWYYLCATFDRDGEFVLYTMNRSDPRSERFWIGGLQGLDSGLSLSLAQNSIGGDASYTRMYVDDLAIWRRTLSSIEVLQIFEMGKLGYSLGDSLVEADVDRDGLSDRWEVENFASLEADALEDPDGDGIDNLIEWAIGSDPMVPSRHPLEQLRQGANKVVISFQSRIELNGHQLRLEVSNDLEQWEPVEQTTNITKVSSLSDFETCDFLIDDGGGRFFRLAAYRKIQ